MGEREVYWQGAGGPGCVQRETGVADLLATGIRGRGRESRVGAVCRLWWRLLNECRWRRQKANLVRGKHTKIVLR